jgi:predicted Rossmann fold flavoprotein
LIANYDLVVIGGGAAGFFCAIQCAERNPRMRILILEKGRDVLNKVRVSGGGRCNVTHACFDPHEMVEHYPRGRKELLGPFHRFLCGDMIQWLSDHGVETKIEEDGRVFPISDNSESIILCFLNECKKHEISINRSSAVESLAKVGHDWIINSNAENIHTNHVLIASGSSPATWKLIENLGHKIIEPVPSLFTFNILHPLLKDLAGVSLEHVNVSIKGSNISQQGPILITHWGLSGPSILKLSAWGARYFHEKNYQAVILVNWRNVEPAEVLAHIEMMRKTNGSRRLINVPLFQVPKRLWQRMIELLQIQQLNVADLQTAQINQLVEILTACPLMVKGKSVNKEEFVTCGGVDTTEINFKTMESRLFPGLYFAGEVLNIDAVTGGFNFQAAWTEAYIAAEAIVSTL